MFKYYCYGCSKEVKNGGVFMNDQTFCSNCFSKLFVTYCYTCNKKLDTEDYKTMIFYTFYCDECALEINGI